MRALAIVLPLAAVTTLAAPTAGAEALTAELDVLYVGNAESPRAADFAAFLDRHFARVRVAERDGFDPKSAEGFDVVLLDWSQRDADLMDRTSIGAPLGPRSEWRHPTVLLGSAGLLVAAQWQTAGSYG